MALPQFPAYARLSQPVSDTICFSSELSWSFCSAVSPERRLPGAYAPYAANFFKNVAVSSESIGPAIWFSGERFFVRLTLHGVHRFRGSLCSIKTVPTQSLSSRSSAPLVTELAMTTTSAIERGNIDLSMRICSHEQNAITAASQRFREAYQDDS